jgi:hypothetical protein
MERRWGRTSAKRKKNTSEARSGTRAHRPASGTRSARRTRWRARRSAAPVTVPTTLAAVIQLAPASGTKRR